ncbi:MAG TPA: amino acid adenylation domain-containing protein [Blastocatellia bacterium]|nr:amino acid adenylation domain-containing protein [Blastocatellia bacterium]
MSAVTETNKTVLHSPPLAECTDTQAEYPRDSCIHQLFEAQVERTPHKIAVVFEDSRLTYSELNARSNRLAHHLRRLGVGPESLVAVFLDRSPDMIVALLGILKAGGAYVPLDPSYPKDRLAFMMEDAQITALVTERRLFEELPAHTSQVVCVDAISETASQDDDENSDCRATAEDLAYVIYTSGSTGRPKGVQVLHRAVVNFLFSMQRRPGLTDEDILLSTTTISFDIAALEIFLPLITGACVVVVSRDVATDGTQLAAEIARSRATILQATPATWRLLLGAGWEGDRKLRMLCGGEALPPDLAARLLERGGCLWNLYGPTETTIWSSLYQVKPGDEKILIGRPIANTQIYLLDEELKPVPVGTPGELYIGGDGLARGYLNRPELTAEKFIKNPISDEPGSRLYRTGDLAQRMPDGQIECLGRIDHQVKIRGFRIELGEIEAALREHASVRESVVVAREDAPGDKRLVAYVVLDSRAPELDSATRAGEMRNLLSARLPDYMIPSAFVAIDRLPLTPNGKIDRNALLAPDRMRPEGRQPLIAPRDPLEHQLVQIWEDVLEVRPIGVRDNFFELGGHSLLAAQMMNEVEQACGKRLALDKLYREATIEALASLLLEGEQQARQSPIVEIRAGGSRQPFFFLHGDHSGGGFYCLNLARRLESDQPFYVLPPHGTDGGRIPPSIEGMAACRLRTLRELQPRGPYLLGGFCNGALVAFEMARQLEREGERVDLLALVYVSATNTRLGAVQTVVRRLSSLFGVEPEKQLEHFLYLRSRIVRSKRALTRYKSRLTELWRAEADVQLAFIQSKAKRLMEKKGRSLSARRGSADVAGRDKATVSNQNGAGAKMATRWDITADYSRLMHGYVPRRYKGRITLFWPEEVARFPGDPTMGWRKVAAGGVEVYPIAGRHLTCITRHVDVLADRLNACLQKVQSGL